MGVGKFYFLAAPRIYPVVEKAGSRPRILTNFRTGIPGGHMLDFFFRKTWLLPTDLEHFAYSSSVVVGDHVNISKEGRSENTAISYNKISRGLSDT